MQFEGLQIVESQVTIVDSPQGSFDEGTTFVEVQPSVVF